MRGSDFITIIVPVYNGEKFISRCLDSLIYQTYSNFEVLVVNDGSTDSTRAILREYESKCSNIRVHDTLHLGVSHARNKGLENARGNLIAFVDSDDEVLPEYLEILYKIMKENDAAIAVCGLKHVRGEGSCIPKSYIAKKDCGETVISNAVCFLEKMEEPFRYELTAICCNKLYNRELFAGLFYPEGKIYEDSAIMQDVMYKAPIIAETDRKLYLYHRETMGITRSAYCEAKLDEVVHAKCRMLFFEEKEEIKLYNLARKQYCITLLKHYYLLKKQKRDSNKNLIMLRSEQKQYLKGRLWKKVLSAKVRIVFELGRFFPYVCGAVIVKWDSYLEKQR